MILTAEQPAFSETETNPVELDAWKKEYPTTREEADAQLEAAREAYYSLEFPQISSLEDTPPKPTIELLADYDKRYLDTYNHSEHGDIQPVLENIRIPPGFEGWTVKKLELAHQLWLARHREWVYTYRIAKERDELTDAKKAGFEPQKNPDQTESREITAVIRGDFEVVVHDGKPELKISGRAELGKEAFERFMTHHRNWVENQKGQLLEKFPRVSFALATMSSAKEFGLSWLKNNFENFILGTYLAYLDLNKHS